MKELKINHLAVFTGIILQFVIGYLWYAPFLFGNAWMEMVGLDLATIEANPPGANVWIINVAASVASLYLLAWLFTQLKVDNWFNGVYYGFLFGFAFVLLSLMRSNAFAQSPYGLAWINGGFTTFGLMIGGGILGAWKRYKS